MQLLADENIPLVTIQTLRAGGHDVLAASEMMAGAADREVLARAGSEGRVLVTFDRDFAALVFKHGAPAPAGIVLLRLVPATPTEPAVVLQDLFSDPQFTFVGKFTVVDRERVRQRSLPAGDDGG